MAHSFGAPRITFAALVVAGRTRRLSLPRSPALTPADARVSILPSCKPGTVHRAGADPCRRPKWSPLRAWTTVATLVMLATLCVSTASAQSASTSPSSAEEVESSLGLERAQRQRIQRGLRASGFDPGSPDGLFGPRTREAIRKWQSSQGKPASGYLDGESARLLVEASETAYPQTQETLDIFSEALSIAHSITEADYRASVLLGVAENQVKAGDSHGVRIPVETDHPFQPKPITDSIPSRSPIPVDADH